MKHRFELMPPEFDDVVLVLQQAAESGKYKENGWLEGVGFEKNKNIASIRRHILDYRKGSFEDKESNLHPLLHAACRALMQYTLDKRDFTQSTNTGPLPIPEDLKLGKIITEYTSVDMCRIPNCIDCGNINEKVKKGLDGGGTNDRGSFKKYIDDSEV